MKYTQNTLDRIKVIAPFVLSDDGGTMVFEHVTAYQVLSMFDESMCAHYGYTTVNAKTLVNGVVVEGALCVHLNLRGGDSDNWCYLHFNRIRNFDAVVYRKSSDSDFSSVDIIEEMQRIKRIDNLNVLLEVVSS